MKNCAGNETESPQLIEAEQ